MHKDALDDLARSGIDKAAAEAAGMFDVPNARKLYSSFKRSPALVIPYYDLDGAPVTFGDGDEFCRVRYVGELGVDPYTGKKAQRYGQPKDSGCFAYFPKVDGMNWRDIAEDPETPVIISEGEKKALATCLTGFACIGLGGVANIMRDGAFLSELEEFKWTGRDAIVIFDSDAATNLEIQRAIAKLVELLHNRGARLYVVQLPPDGKAKVGLDDYLVKHGLKRLMELIERTGPVGDLGACIMALNKNVALIDSEGSVYDLNSETFMSKEYFISGSIYSTLRSKKSVTTGKQPGLREVSVASEWLTHPQATRYSDILFRPGDEAVVTARKGSALNMWTGWNARPGDVQPFFDLSEHLFSKLPEEQRLFALQLLAYKAQHPQEKVPIAIVLIGQQGCGKSLWAECVAGAFKPYSVPLRSTALVSPFQGWVEKSVIATMDEVEPEHLEAGGDNLKALISNGSWNMNEKFRAEREVASYSTFILTSNHRRVGAYSADDRRMFVVDCADKRELDFYIRIRDWKNSSGPQHLMDWLLTVPLDGWRPPQSAPVTVEKIIAHQESLSPAQRLALDMQTAKEHIIKLWIDTAMAWAEENMGSNIPALQAQARQTVEIMKEIQIRPWYASDELAAMFPHIAATLGANKRTKATSAGELSRLLREYGIKYLQPKDDPRGFVHKGKLRQYLVVADHDDWTMPLSQAEFERCMANYPRYKQISKNVLLRGRT